MWLIIIIKLCISIIKDIYNFKNQGLINKNQGGLYYILGLNMFEILKIYLNLTTDP